MRSSVCGLPSPTTLLSRPHARVKSQFLPALPRPRGGPTANQVRYLNCSFYGVNQLGGFYLSHFQTNKGIIFKISVALDATIG